MLKKYYSALVGDGRVSRPSYDEARADLRRAYLTEIPVRGWNAGLDRPHSRRI